MPELVECPCSVTGCLKQVLKLNAKCGWCSRIYCEQHDAEDSHPCTGLQKMLHHEADLKVLKQIKADATRRCLTRLLEQVKLNLKTIIFDAKALRPGHDCSLDIPSTYEQLEHSKWFAQFNVHFLLTFDDGVKWLVRVRQNHGQRLPAELRVANLKSEVTTLNFLKENGVPVPRAFVPTYLQTGGNDKQGPKLDYFYYEFLQGHTRSTLKDEDELLDLPKDELRQLIHGYADIMMKLSQAQVPVESRMIGCLYPIRNSTDPKAVGVGPIIASGCFMTPRPPYLLGPFRTLKERYIAHIDATLHYITLGALLDSSVDAYLWHLELREFVNASNILGDEPEALYVKHADEKPDILMYDDDGAVIGAIDWEWAFATTKEEAFAAPAFLFERKEYTEGCNVLSEHGLLLIAEYEKHDRVDLADCFKNGRLYQRLREIGQYDSRYNKNGFREVFDVRPPDFNPTQGDEGWRKYMMKRYKDDERLANLMQ